MKTIRINDAAKINRRLFQLRQSSGLESPGSAVFEPGGWNVPTFTEMCETRSLYVQKCLRVKVLDVSLGRLSMMLQPSKAEHKMDVNVRLMGLIDHCGGYGAWTLLTKQHFLSTINMRIDFLNQISDDYADAVIADNIVSSSDDRFIRSDVTCWNADRSKKLALGRLLFGRYPSLIGLKEPPEDFSERELRATQQNSEVMSITVEGTVTSFFLRMSC
jgi:hypothetical protein